MAENTDIEQDMTTPFLLKVWHVAMFFCTASLYVLGTLSKDNSVYLYVALGIITMLIAPVENIIGAVVRNNELKKEYEERNRKLAERRANLNEGERQEQEREKIKAANEFAKRHAAKSGSAQGV